LIQAPILIHVLPLNFYPIFDGENMKVTKLHAVVAVLSAFGLAACASTSQTPTAAPAAAPPVAAPAPAKAAMPSARVAHFAFDSSAVDDDARRMMRAYADYLAANPNAKVRLEGHADERGTKPYNKELGARRAQAMAKTLSTMGINGNRVAVASYGEDRPAVAGRDEQSWAQNRRVEVILQ
jgi:peptidoglycan-associated lipoprotein